MPTTKKQLHYISILLFPCFLASLLPPSTRTPAAAAQPGTVASSAGSTSLSVGSSSAGVSVQSLDSAGNGWQLFFNASQGGGITSVHEIDAGSSTELMQQAVLHSLIQSYLQIGGVFLSNQQLSAQISIVRNSPELVILRTVSSNPTYHVTWTYTYSIWPGGEMYIRLTIQNTGSASLKLSLPDSIEINHDGQVLADYPDQSPYTWYSRAGVVTSPVPSAITSIEPDLFGRMPTASSANKTGFMLDKLTAWSSAGITSYGMRDYSGGTNGRAKDQWMGSLSSIAAGQAVSFSLLEVLSRRLTQVGSTGIDADYRRPNLTVLDGSLASSDGEPNPITLTNGFNWDLGAYVVASNGNHMSAELTFPPGVPLRLAPRFKLTKWTGGAPVLTWDGQALHSGSDYSYVLDPSDQTLYLQLNFDVVTSVAQAGQQVNALLDISTIPGDVTTPEPSSTQVATLVAETPTPLVPTDTPVLPTNTPAPSTSTPVSSTTTVVSPTDTPTAVPATLLVSDSFVRVNSTTGWGMAGDGNTWSFLAGTASPGGVVNVSNAQGTIASSASSLFTVLGPSVASPDQEGLVRWSVGSTSSTAGILLRAQDANNYYLARYAGNGMIQLYVKANGMITRLTAFALSPTLRSLYWMRFRVKGTTIAVKAWADGTTEPSSWGYTTTDISLSASGSVGLYGYASTSTPVTFDSFAVTAY